MINAIYQLVQPKVFVVKYGDVDWKNKVIFRPRYLALCHADQRYYQGKRDAKVLRKKLPMALIHECCGQVVYDPTGTFKKGQWIVPIPNSPQHQDGIIFENYAQGSRFLSSGHDGFMREVVDLPPDRVVACTGVRPQVAAITEFVSVGVHAVRRFAATAHSYRRRVGIWGDGSLSYIVSCILTATFPELEVYVVGKNRRKLSQFSFVKQTFLIDELPEDFWIDHAFECAGGEGSAFAIDDMIRYIRPQGNVMLMGVSEHKVAVNTRDVLEKGLTMIGCSRSGRADFEQAVSLMQRQVFQQRLQLIIAEDDPVRTIKDLHRVFRDDLTIPFKTVFGWEM